MKTLFTTTFVWLAFSATAFAQLFVNGGELYWLRTPEDFALWYHYSKHRLVFDASWPDRGTYEGCRVPDYVTPALAYSWPERISQGFGVWDGPFYEGDKASGKAPEGAKALGDATINALNRADDVVWFFPSACDTWLTDPPKEYVAELKRAVYEAKGPAKLILFGNFSRDQKPKNTPAYIALNRTKVEKLPFDGLTVYLRSGEQSYDQGLCRKIFSKTPVKSAEIADALFPLTNPITGILGSRLDLYVELQAFLAPAADDDAGWAVLIGNLEKLRAIIKKVGISNFKGVFLDTENYNAPGGWLSFPKPNLDDVIDTIQHTIPPLGYDEEQAEIQKEYASQLAKYELMQARAFKRGQQVRQAIGMDVITTVAPIFSMTNSEHPYVKGAYELLGPFQAGMVSGGKE